MRITEYLREKIASFDITQRHVDNIVKQIESSDGIKKVFSLLKQNNVISSSYNLKKNINNLKALINLISKPKVNKIKKVVSEATGSDFEAKDILVKASKKILRHYLDIEVISDYGDDESRAEFTKAIDFDKKVTGLLKRGFINPLLKNIPKLFTHEGASYLSKMDIAIMADAIGGGRVKIEVKKETAKNLYAELMKIATKKAADRLDDKEKTIYNKAVINFFSKGGDEVAKAYERAKNIYQIYLMVTIKSNTDAIIYHPKDYDLKAELGPLRLGLERIQIKTINKKNSMTPTGFIQFLISKNIITEGKVYDLDKLLKGFII